MACLRASASRSPRVRVRVMHTSLPADSDDGAVDASAASASPPPTAGAGGGGWVSGGLVDDRVLGRREPAFSGLLSPGRGDGSAASSCFMRILRLPSGGAEVGAGASAGAGAAKAPAAAFRSSLWRARVGYRKLE